MYGVDPHPCKVCGIKFQEIILIYSFNLHLEWETNIIEMVLENDPIVLVNDTLFQNMHICSVKT